MKVLIVEDETFIASSIAEILQRGGYEVAGIAATADEVIRHLSAQRSDLAVVDANLAGSSSAPVATALTTRQIPFVVVSGYAQRELLLPLRQAPFVPKPILESELLEALNRVSPRAA